MNQHVAITPQVEAEQDFTTEDFLRMMECGAFEDMRVELVRGKLVKMSPAGPIHGISAVAVIARLWNALSEADGRMAADLAVVIERGTVRGPDIALLREPWAGERPVQAAALELAVEISDTSIGQDLGEKSADYARANVPTYWVVDVKARATYVLMQPVDGVYQSRRIVAFADPLVVPGTDATIVIA